MSVTLEIIIFFFLKKVQIKWEGLSLNKERNKERKGKSNVTHHSRRRI